MFRSNVYVLIFILQIAMITGIMINGKTVKYPKIAEVPKVDVKKENAETILFDQKYKNSDKNEDKKSNLTRGSPISSKEIINTASNKFERRIPFLNHYIPQLLSTTIKPIYETDHEQNKEIFHSNKNFGYSYDQPTEDFYVTKEKIKEIKNSHQSQDLATSIVMLDRFLKTFFNADSHNNPVHLPTNPILSLILSRYGKYISGIPNSGLYSYMAVNNIHNNKPFGQYKYEHDELM